MEDLIGIGLGRKLFNFIGAVVRWTYGTIWRTIANKKKYKFSEYLNGPEKTEDWFDQKGHKSVNRVIGIVTLIAFLFLLASIIK